MSELFRRLRYLLRRGRLERELADEMEFHREMAAGGGGTPFGNSLALREQAREAWGWTWIDRLWQDTRYTLRTLRRSPGFTLAAVLMLAAGTGVNVAVFGFFNLMLLRPLDVRDPDGLLRFHRRNVHQFAFATPYPEAAFLREHARTVALFAVNSTSVFLEDEGSPVEARFVTANYFRELGGSAAAGRLLDPALDEGRAAEPVVVLSHGFWKRRFAADPSVVGRTLRVNGRAVTVVGIAASGFSGVGSGINEPVFWAAITQQPQFVSGSRLLTDVSVESDGVTLWGRLREGQNAKAAEEELRALAAELRHRYPEAIWEDERLPSEPGGYLSGMITGSHRGTGTEVRTPIYPVFALAGALCLMILAVACGNVGGMLLARSMARQREISIRIAIGAGRGRLIRQLLTESVLLGLAGAAVGLVLGSQVLTALFKWTGAPAWLNASPDWRVALFAVGIGFISAVMFGLTPALQLGRQRQSGHMARQILTGAQVAASCVLLIVTALLMRALNHATSSPLGYEYKQVVSISPGLGRNGYTPARARSYLEALRERLSAVPGVQSVALAVSPPLGHVTMTAGLQIQGRQVDVQFDHASPEFFATMKIPILRGRGLRTGERHVVVVSESMARQAWPGQDPLGKSFVLGEEFTVVGVSGNVRSIRFGDTEKVHAYFPIEERDLTALTMLVRTGGSTQEVAKMAMVAARGLDANTFPEVEGLSSAYRTALEGAEYSVLAVSVLGSIAQLLACFGIAGVVAYTVSQRTREIGIRMALGAKQGQVLRVVLRNIAGPVAVGALIGLAGGAGLAQVMRGRLYGISHVDAAAYGAALGVLAVTAALAALLPARKALRIDPLRALRYE